MHMDAANHPSSMHCFLWWRQTRQTCSQKTHPKEQAGGARQRPTLLGTKRTHARKMLSIPQHCYCHRHRHATGLLLHRDPPRDVVPPRCRSTTTRCAAVVSLPVIPRPHGFGRRRQANRGGKCWWPCDCVGCLAQCSTMCLRVLQ